jgi:pyrroloquinoline quinone biosynthesis protein B
MRLAILLCWISFPTLILAQNQTPFVLVLGITQDGGYPHIGCHKSCCSRAINNDSLKQNVVALALADPLQKKWWLFEATPDITNQLQLFQKLTNKQYSYLPDGIFLTHAHIGHYTGLMYLGHEALNPKNVSVYAMPKMSTFLKSNGPWSQLISLNNIQVKPIVGDQEERLSGNISVTPFTVPHRDEFSETVGYKINTGIKRYLFIPDIDKWGKWNKNS